MFGILSAIIAFVLIIVEMDDAQHDHFSSSHMQLGIVVIIFALGQPVFGLVARLVSRPGDWLRYIPAGIHGIVGWVSQPLSTAPMHLRFASSTLSHLHSILASNQPDYPCSWIRCALDWRCRRARARAEIHRTLGFLDCPSLRAVRVLAHCAVDARSVADCTSTVVVAKARSRKEVVLAMSRRRRQRGTVRKEGADGRVVHWRPDRAGT